MTRRSTPFGGVIPPVVTPLTADGEVDAYCLERLVGHLLGGGVTGLFALGSSGETAYLTEEQRNTVLEIIIGVAAGEVPVLAGAIETSTNRVIERARVAQKAGAAAIVATAPFYIRTDESEIGRHFRAIRTAVDIPLFAYDVPVCVHNKLSPAIVLELARDGVLAGIKDSSGDDVGFRSLTIAAAALPAFSVLTGHEVVVDAMLLGGADGCVPGLANVDPHGYRRLTDAAAAGDWVTAKAEQDRLAALFEIVSVAQDTSDGASGVGAFKTALRMLGVIGSNAVSMPMRALREDEAAVIGRILERAELL